MLGDMSMAMYNAGERVSREELKSIIFASEARDVFSRTLQGRSHYFASECKMGGEKSEQKLKLAFF